MKITSETIETMPAIRKATPHEIERLADPNEGNYSAEDAATAEVVARDEHGAILYRLPSATSDIRFAVESGSGEIYAGMSAEEAAQEWN